MLSSTDQSTTSRATSCQSSITAICTAISLTSSTNGIGFVQPAEQRLMKLRRLLHLRRVAQTREFNQCRLGDQLRHLLAEYIVMTDFRLDLGRCDVFVDGRGVGGAD